MTEPTTNCDDDVFDDAEWNALTRALALSPKQVQIVRRVIQGMSDKRIALELNMSMATVRTHLSRLFAKLDIQNRNELILLVFRQFRANSPQVHCDPFRP
jgi:DNA-binding CsgD family transcriptional regulator